MDRRTAAQMLVTTDWVAQHATDTGVRVVRSMSTPLRATRGTCAGRRAGLLGFPNVRNYDGSWTE